MPIINVVSSTKKSSGTKFNPTCTYFEVWMAVTLTTGRLSCFEAWMFPLMVYILIWWFILEHIHEFLAASWKFYDEYSFWTSRWFQRRIISGKLSILHRPWYQKISRHPFRRIIVSSIPHKETNLIQVETFLKNRWKFHGFNFG